MALQSILGGGGPVAVENVGATPVTKQLGQPQEELLTLDSVSLWCLTLKNHVTPLPSVSSSVKEGVF